MFDDLEREFLDLRNEIEKIKTNIQILAEYVQPYVGDIEHSDECKKRNEDGIRYHFGTSCYCYAENKEKLFSREKSPIFSSREIKKLTKDKKSKKVKSNV